MGSPAGREKGFFHELPGYEDASPSNQERMRAEFKQKFFGFWHELRAKGLAPNEAAAIGLKLASGVTEAPLDLEDLQERVQTAKATGNFVPVTQVASKVFSSIDTLNYSFCIADRAEQQPFEVYLREEQRKKNLDRGPGGEHFYEALRVDFRRVRETYDSLATCCSNDVEAALVKAQCKLLDEYIDPRNAQGKALLKHLLIVLENPFLGDQGYGELIGKVCRISTSMSAATQQGLVLALQGFKTDNFRLILYTVLNYISTGLLDDLHDVSESVEAATFFLNLLYEANHKAGNIVPYTHFYNEAVNRTDFNIKEDYKRWKSGGFSFCNFPYMYDPATKARILRHENSREQFNEFEDAVLQLIFTRSSCPYLLLKVRRGPNLIPDTLREIHMQVNADGLKKPLKVHFIGEEGVDEGGVQKEFFHLLLRDIFDPNYGMFTYDEETRLFWFKASDLDLELEYELIGIVLGLAIYNHHILHLAFPTLIYKKLMGYGATFEDLREIHPMVHQSLTKVLDYTGDVEEDFGLTFRVEYDSGFGGGIQFVDLVSGGEHTAVTKENRHEYVELYSRWLLEDSVQRQFSAFARGFKRLCDGIALQLFRPEELEKLICGSQDFDVAALQASTVYEDGFTAQSPVVQNFWKVVFSFSEAAKKRLLFFATGSDRIPINGLGSLNPPFTINKNGGHSERLPTAHTCFNILLLPEYQDLETLRERLTKAIDNAEGFGLQ